MMLSWGFLLPSGVIIAHFMRHRKSPSDPPQIWFKLHRIIQVSGLTLALIGVTIALARFKVFVGAVSRANVHGTMGLITMSIGILQPINAWLRPHKMGIHQDGPKKDEPIWKILEKYEVSGPVRRGWEILHKGGGYLAILLALGTVSLGTTLTGQYKTGFQVGWAIVLTVHAVHITALILDAKSYVDPTAAASDKPKQPEPTPGELKNMEKGAGSNYKV